MSTTTEYNTIDEAWEAGNEWVKTSSRHEMLDFLTETASPEFRDTLLTEMVNYMSDKDFAQFFNHLRRNYGVITPQEIAYVNEH
jgi:uncharacterized protein YPO0396